MSWASVCIFREPVARKDVRKHDPEDSSTWQQGWEEMTDTLEQAARYLQDKADPALVAVECDDDGKLTGVILRYRPEEFAWIEENEAIVQSMWKEKNPSGGVTG